VRAQFADERERLCIVHPFDRVSGARVAAKIATIGMALAQSGARRAPTPAAD